MAPDVVLMVTAQKRMNRLGIPCLAKMRDMGHPRAPYFFVQRWRGGGKLKGCKERGEWAELIS